jgi:hypothetical protein
MVSAIGIVSLPFELFRWNKNVLSVLSAPRVDSVIIEFNISRIAVRIVATAEGGIIRHVPSRIESLMQRLILRRMVPPGLALRTFLRRSLLRQRPHCQQATDQGPEQELALDAQYADSLSRHTERQGASG